MIELEEELVELFGRGVDAPLSEAAFNHLALAVFRHQFERNRPYGAYCRLRGRTLDTVTDWTQVPALPTAAFKEADQSTFGAPQELGASELAIDSIGPRSAAGTLWSPGVSRGEATAFDRRYAYACANKGPRRSAPLRTSPAPTRGARRVAWRPTARASSSGVSTGVSGWRAADRTEHSRCRRR